MTDTDIYKMNAGENTINLYSAKGQRFHIFNFNTNCETHTKLFTTMKLRKRPLKDTPVHKITRILDGMYIIERTKEPLISVIYNPNTREGKLFQGIRDGVQYKPFKPEKIQAAVKKAIAWARNTIVG